MSPGYHGTFELIVFSREWWHMLCCAEVLEDLDVSLFQPTYSETLKKNSGALVLQRNTATEWPPIVGEVSANFSG
jgi:hypothetical protein